MVKVETFFIGMFPFSKEVMIMDNEINLGHLIPSVVDHGGFGGRYGKFFFFFLLLLGIFSS